MILITSYDVNSTANSRFNTRSFIAISPELSTVKKKPYREKIKADFPQMEFVFVGSDTKATDAFIKILQRLVFPKQNMHV